MRSFTCFILCLLLSVQGLAQPRSTLQVLRNDERLGKRVTVKHAIIPLQELLSELRQQVGIPLSVSRDVAEDKVTIFVHQQPLRDVMTQLADLLQADWTFVEREKGYRLTPKASFLQMERSLREEEAKAAQRALMEDLRQRSQLAQMDYLDIVSLVEAANSMAQGNEEADSALTDEERSLLQLLKTSQPSLFETLREMVALEHYLPAWVVQRFTEQHWQQLFNGEPVVASTHPSPGMIPLPVEQSLRWNARIWGERENIQGLELVLQMSEGRDRVIGRLTRFGFQEGKRTFQGATSNHVWENPYITSPGKNMEKHPLLRFWEKWRTPQEQMKVSPVLLEKIEDDSEVASKRSDDSIWAQRPITVADCLRWLSEHTDLNILADAYRFGIGASGYEETGIPVYRWVEKVLVPNGWVKAEGDWLLFRHRGYWQLRPSEVPERVLRPLESKARKQPLDVDDYAELAAQLTSPQEERVQVATSRRFVVNFDTEPLVGNIPALRFWASLSAPQRERARRGERLPFENLSARQKSLFRQAYRYRLLRMSEQPSAQEEEPSVHFSWQLEEREEFRAYGKYGYYSSKTLETLMETVHLNQQEAEYNRYARLLFRDITLRFAAEQGVVSYQIPLKQAQPL